MSEIIGWAAVVVLGAAAIGWGVAVLRALGARKEAQESLEAARVSGDAARVVVAEQRAADRTLGVQRLTRWLRRRDEKRRAA